MFFTLLFVLASFDIVLSSEKLCRFDKLEQLYPSTPWKLLTGGFCYFYSNPTNFIEKYEIKLGNYPENNKTFSVPYSVVNNSYLLYDYENEIYSKIVESSFLSETLFRKWVSCSQNAVTCCNETMNEKNIYPSKEFPCPAVWDAWSCFPQTRAGEISYVECPNYAYTPDEVICKQNSEKYCLSDGWNKTTNYATCTLSPVYKRRHKFHVKALTTATAFIIPALVILFAFPKLRVLRNVLHRNLLISIILRNILTIMSKSIVVLDSLKPPNETNSVLVNNSVGCRILAFLENVSKNAIFTCMLVDAFYLHKLIVRIFAKDPRKDILYGVTIGLSILPSLIWAILMGLAKMENCWMVDTQTWYQWITDGYKYGVLIANIILLFDILRVLILKLSQNTTAQHTKSTLRATLFLIPLFGIPQLFAAQRNIVKLDTCKGGDIYYYIIYSVEGLQGVLVAVLFCYLNSEVHTEIISLYNRLNSRIRDILNLDEKTLFDRRRTTAMTQVRTSVGPKLDTSHIDDWPRSSNEHIEGWFSGNFDGDTKVQNKRSK